MRKMKIIISNIFAFSIIFTGGEYALANTQSAVNTSGTISNLSISSTGVAWFTYTGTVSGTAPTCAASNGLLQIDSTQSGYQQVLAALLTAQSRGSLISYYGTGECGANTAAGSGHERVGYVQLVN